MLIFGDFQYVALLILLSDELTFSNRQQCSVSTASYYAQTASGAWFHNLGT